MTPTFPRDGVSGHAGAIQDAVLAKSALSCIGDNRNELAGQLLSLID
jgi:hypothetical protein